MTNDTNVHWHEHSVSREEREKLNGHRGCVVWFTGLSGCGKSTVSNLVDHKLHAMGKRSFVLDGDNVRHGLNRDLGFSDADRVENIRRVAEVARLFVEAGLVVLCSFISPFRAERRMVRELVDPEEFVEIFVDTPLEVCMQRDPKGLYARASEGKIRNFTGIDSPYEVPENPEIVIRTASMSADEAAQRVIALLRERQIVSF